MAAVLCFGLLFVVSLCRYSAPPRFRSLYSAGLKDQEIRWLIREAKERRVKHGVGVTVLKVVRNQLVQSYSDVPLVDSVLDGLLEVIEFDVAFAVRVEFEPDVFFEVSDFL